MKKILMTTLAVLGFTVLFAQHHEGGHGKSAQADKLKSVLSLSEEQYARAKAIDSKYAGKHAELRKDSTSRMTKHDAFKTMRRDKRQELESILTPEQKTKWSDYRAEQKTKRKEQHEQFKKQRGERIKKELALTDEQQKRIDATNQKFKQKADALRKSGSPKDSNRPEFKKLHDERNAEIKSILSEEQYQKWLSLRKENKHGKRYHHRRG